MLSRAEANTNFIVFGFDQNGPRTHDIQLMRRAREPIYHRYGQMTIIYFTKTNRANNKITTRSELFQNLIEKIVETKVNR